MKNGLSETLNWERIVLGILVLGLAVLGFFYYQSTQDVSNLTVEKTSVLSELETVKAVSTAKETELLATISELQAKLDATEEERKELASELDDEKDRNDAFEDKIGKIGKTVGTLDKLAKTDKELLIKYSKVSFLNEHYAPAKLETIPAQYRTRPADDEFFNASAWPKLKKLLDDAHDDGIDISVLSAYRSFDSQKQLKNAYTVTYGTGANAFSADQGYSEHQLGTALDFSSKDIGGTLTGFHTIKAYEWLQKNAYKYGFILSYPSGNAYYIFEPWHWRYVGEDLARDLHDEGKFFYDVDQREIDKYLISIFD